MEGLPSVGEELSAAALGPAASRVVANSTAPSRWRPGLRRCKRVSAMDISVSCCKNRVKESLTGLPGRAERFFGKQQLYTAHVDACVLVFGIGLQGHL